MTLAVRLRIVAMINIFPSVQIKYAAGARVRVKNAATQKNVVRIRNHSSVLSKVLLGLTFAVNAKKWMKDAQATAITVVKIILLSSVLELMVRKPKNASSVRKQVTVVMKMIGNVVARSVDTLYQLNINAINSKTETCLLFNLFLNEYM